MSEQRRFSIDDDFMKARVDGQLYGFMRCISTAMPDGDRWKEYLPISVFNNRKKIGMQLCGIKSTATLNNHIKKLAAAGLVEQGTFTSGGIEYDCYYFPYDYDGIYKVIDIDMLELLVNTGNNFSIKIYLYLLNKSGMKADYEFTITEINKAFGYSEDSKTSEKIISDCLLVFKKLGIIDYEETYKKFYSTHGKEMSKPIKVLKKVATKRPKELQKSQMT